MKKKKNNNNNRVRSHAHPTTSTHQLTRVWIDVAVTEQLKIATLCKIQQDGLPQKVKVGVFSSVRVILLMIAPHEGTNLLAVVVCDSTKTKIPHLFSRLPF